MSRDTLKGLFTAPRTKSAEDKPPEAPLVVSNAEGGHLRTTLWAASRSAPGGICLRHDFKVRLPTESDLELATRVAPGDSREEAKYAKKGIQRISTTDFHRIVIPDWIRNLLLTHPPNCTSGRPA